jgi:cell division protein FtsL
MKTAFLKYGLVLIALVFSAAMLMHVSQNVQQLERDITRYDYEIDKEKEKIRVLNAEWAYLNNPKRLEVLAAGGYDMQIPKTAAMVSDPARLPNIFTPDQSALSSIIPSSGASYQKTQNNDKLSLHPQTKGEHE